MEISSYGHVAGALDEYTVKRHVRREKAFYEAQALTIPRDAPSVTGRVTREML